MSGACSEVSVRILQGDCRSVLKSLPDQSVHCVVTSPPFWGLRDYQTATWEGGDPFHEHDRITARSGRGGSGSPGKQTAGSFPSDHGAPICSCGAVKTDQQIGLEQSPQEYVAELVSVFREVWRVLRDDGTVWLNLGDSYSPTNRGENARPRSDLAYQRYMQGEHMHADLPTERGRIRAVADMGIKQKDLVGIPWMVAFALRDDGWWLRQDNIWAKRNCMPESIRDRTTRAHEYMFLLTKSGSSTLWTHRDKNGVRQKPEPDYRWQDVANDDAETDQEPADWRAAKLSDGRKRWRRINLWSGHDYFYDATAIEEDGDIEAGTRAAKGGNVRSSIKEVNGRPPEYFEYTGKRNKRSVWWIATQPFPESHFAVFPDELVKPCILAGTSERGVCAACGAPWTRQTEKVATGRVRQRQTAGLGTAIRREPLGLDAVAGEFQEGVERRTVGWLPSCQCAAEVVPATVLDPFAGAFTCPMVADRLQRNAIGIELSEAYCKMARDRLVKDAGMFAELASD